MRGLSELSEAAEVDGGTGAGETRMLMACRSVRKCSGHTGQPRLQSSISQLGW